MATEQPDLDPALQVFLDKLDSKQVKEVPGLKPDSIYKPYTKEKEQSSGIAARPLCSILFLAGQQLSKEDSNPGYFSRKVLKKTQDLIDYIIENQKDGFIDYSKQEELATIYEELASIKKYAWPVGKTGDFNAAEVFEAIKRFYWPQVGEYLAEYAHENAKDLPPMLAGASNITTTSAKVSVGKVIGSQHVVGASLVGSLGYTNTKSVMRRYDDNVTFQSDEHAGTLEATVKAGVGPAKGVVAPTGTFPHTAVNIAGTTGTVGIGVAKRNGTRIRPANAGAVKVEDGFVIGGQNGNKSKSLKSFKWVDQIFNGANLEEVGIHDNTFTGSDGEKNKIIGDEFKEILQHNGIDASDARHSFIKFTTADEKQKKSHEKFNHYVGGDEKLPANKRNSRVSTTSYKVGGSFSASLLEFGKVQANAQLGYEVTDIVFCFGPIDIATTERTVVKKLNTNTPQYAFNNANEIIKTFENDKGFTDTFDVLKDIKRITAQIHRGETKTEQIKNLFKKMADIGLISPDDLINKKLQEKLCGDANKLKIYIMLAYINFLTGAYDLHEQNKIPADELAKLNKQYSGFANFVADSLWTGPTPAHTAAQEKYHEVFALKPKDPLTVSTATVGAGMSFGLTVGKEKSVDHRKHALTNMLGVDIKLTRTAVDNHPALNRNKNDLTVDISLTGAVIDGASLIKLLIDRLKKEPGLENKAEAMAKSAVNGLWLLYNSASDIDKITGKAGLPVSPFIFAGNQPAASLGLQVIYNLTAEEFDFYGISLTNTRGLGFDSSSVTSWVDAALPASGSVVLGYYNSEKDMLFSRFSGTTSIIGLIREVCAGFGDVKEFGKEELIPFLQKLKKNKELAGLVDFGQVALDNKDKASGEEPKGAFDAIAKKSGPKCSDQNEEFKKVFANAENITEATIEKYKNAIKKLDKSDDTKEAAASLTDGEWQSIKEVFGVWKSANAAYTNMDKAFKEHIELALHIQPAVIKLNELQGQKNLQKESSLGLSIPR